jgi:hypothetical protein
MTENLAEFAKELFKSAQHPRNWLSSAERLHDAAEAILNDQLSKEAPYFKAYRVAREEAVAEAYLEGKDAGVAEVKAVPPNYPPAQLLYAYAIENVLKGLIIANAPQLVDGQKLNTALTSHDLIKLSEKAQFPVHVKERPVLEALSQLSVWAGRYPVARTRDEHVGTPNSEELLDYGSAHLVMRRFFERAHKELEGRLPQAIGSGFGSIVVFRQPGT